MLPLFSDNHMTDMQEPKLTATNSKVSIGITIFFDENALQ